jgi:hypothetical protein
MNVGRQRDDSPWRVAALVEPKLGRHCNGGGRILPLRRDVLD